MTPERHPWFYILGFLAVVALITYPIAYTVASALVGGGHG